MEQVAAKQRMKVATKDHILISKVHLALHSEGLPYVVVILFTLAIATLIIVAFTRPSVESEWKVTGMPGGVVSCRNVETGKTKRFEPQRVTFFEVAFRGYVFLRLQTDELWEVQVGDHIILRDDGWFDAGNNFVRISQKHTDKEAVLLEVPILLGAAVVVLALVDLSLGGK